VYSLIIKNINIFQQVERMNAESVKKLSGIPIIMLSRMQSLITYCYTSLLDLSITNTDERITNENK
jgi:hypothetical protein